MMSNQGKHSPLLDLFLRINTNNSRIDSSVWDFLSIQDTYKLRVLSKSTRDALEKVEYNRCRDGTDYLVPFPGFPGVLLTPSDVKNGAGLFTHQLASLKAMHKAENNDTQFGALRGGILGDAPGLGKTITMLALIASTAGCKPKEPDEFYDNEAINEHWKIMRVNPVFREEILKSLKPIRDFINVNNPKGYNLFREVAEFASPPYSDRRFPTVGAFEAFVTSKMKGTVPASTIDLFRMKVVAFKAGLDKRNRRLFNNPIGKRMMLERNLIPASTNLIIVPDALLEHWAEQIRRHIKIEVFADSIDGHGCEGVVYIDGVGDISTARFPLNHNSSKPMLSQFELANYLIVLVPFSRIEEQNYMRKRRRNEDVILGTDLSTASRSPLLRLRWFRIIVDEGHELGEHEAATDVTNFINDLASERRWVMSGTPTTGDEDSPDFTAKGLDQLQRLLLFLRHPKYGMSCDGQDPSVKHKRELKKELAKSAWNDDVKIPFLNKIESGREKLYKILHEVMVMHKKEDINLPKPIFKQGEVTIFIPPSVQSTIVDTVHSAGNDTAAYLEAMANLGVSGRRLVSEELRREIELKCKGSARFDLLLSEYLGTDSFQSLVDEKQAHYIVEAVKRERSELNARGGSIPDDSNAPITAATSSNNVACDRRPIKVVVYSQSHSNLLSVAEYIYRSFQAENIAELTEGKIADMAYELGRFRNSYKEGKKCRICGGWNDYNGKKLIGCRRLLMEVCDAEGRTFLIEPERVNSAVGQVEFNKSNNGAVGTPVDMIRLGGAPLSDYRISHKNWQVGDSLCINARGDHPLFQKRWSHNQWAAYGSDRCMELAEKDNFQGRDGFLGPLPDYEERCDSVHVKLNKWQVCGKFHGKNRWYLGPTLEDVDLEKELQDVFILLLDAKLSHGLDLSFVTHLFLLEPIDDAALLEQVTSRAHRLGCTGPVTIETVNVWQELDGETKKLAKDLSSVVQDEDRKVLSKAVCEHCYRSFESIETAEIHEQSCERNPDSEAVVDPFHLSSVYRDIKPPVPVPVCPSENIQ